jgi:hypothetical protein
MKKRSILGWILTIVSMAMLVISCASGPMRPMRDGATVKKMNYGSPCQAT